MTYEYGFCKPATKNVANYCEKHKKFLKINKLDGGFICSECTYENFSEMEKAHKEGNLFRICPECGNGFQVPKYRSVMEKFCNKCKKCRYEQQGEQE